LIHHQINHKALETLAMARSRRPYTQVNLLLLLLQEQGDFLLASTPTGDEEPYDMRETLRSLAKMEEAQVVPLLSISYNYNPSSQPEGPTTSLQSVATDDNGTPVTWTLVLFQQATDRQDRTS